MNLKGSKIVSLRYIKVKSIYEAILLFLLVMPDNFFSAMPIYESNTPGYIAYKWLDYACNISLFIILLIGFAISFCHNDKWLLMLIGYSALREVLFLMTPNSCIRENAYEIYITLFTGIAFAKIVQYTAGNTNELNRFFWKVILLNIFTVYLSVALGATASNRYHASNMDAGSTGTLCGFTIVYCLFKDKINNKWFFALFALIALFLSGSRINLLLTATVLIIGFLIKFSQKKNFNKNMVLGFIGAAIICFALLFFADMAKYGLSVVLPTDLNRMLTSFDSDVMSQDSSVLGRVRSIIIGFDILKNNIFGISGYFINLQSETIQRGFPTFPHSSLLNYFILMGPIMIILVFYIFLLLKKLIRSYFEQFLVLLYAFLFITLSGGPIINFKLIFIYVTIFIISVKKCGKIVNFKWRHGYL